MRTLSLHSQYNQLCIKHEIYHPVILCLPPHQSILTTKDEAHGCLPLLVIYAYKIIYMILTTCVGETSFYFTSLNNHIDTTLLW